MHAYAKRIGLYLCVMYLDVSAYAYIHNLCICIVIMSLSPVAYTWLLRMQIHTVAVGAAIGQACLLLAAGSKGKRFMMPHAKGFI